MKVLGIIPSRYGSSRFPGKPLVDILGKSMIQRVYEQAKKSQLLTEVVVATDDQRIFDHVNSFGGNVMMTSEEHRSGTERCGEVIEAYSEIDVVINIQGDEPLVDPGQLDDLLSLFKQPDVFIGTIVKKISNKDDIFNENRIKVVLDHSKNGVYFSRSPIPFNKNVAKKDWLTKSTYYKHIGIYAWRLNTLKEILELTPTELEKMESLEQLRWLYYGYKIRTVETTRETPNIDVPEDVEIVINAIENK